MQNKLQNFIETDEGKKNREREREGERAITALKRTTLVRPSYSYNEETSNYFPRRRYVLWFLLYLFYELIAITVSYRIARQHRKPIKLCGCCAGNCTHINNLVNPSFWKLHNSKFRQFVWCYIVGVVSFIHSTLFIACVFFFQFRLSTHAKQSDSIADTIYQFIVIFEILAKLNGQSVERLVGRIWTLPERFIRN